MSTSTKRYAVVTGAGRGAGEVSRYLPDAYVVIGETTDAVVIGGFDYAGWTLDAYVMPRLGSGLMGAREVTRDEVVERFGAAFVGGE